MLLSLLLVAEADPGNYLLEGVAAKYDSVSDYHFDVRVVKQLEISGFLSRSSLENRYIVAASGPTKFRYELYTEATRSIRVSDGHRTWVYQSPPNQYVAMQAGAASEGGEAGSKPRDVISESRDAFHKVNSALFSRFRLFPKMQKRAELLGTQELKVGSRRVLCSVVSVVPLAAGEKWKERLWIDRESSLVLKSVFIEAVPSPPGHISTYTTTRTWDYIQVGGPLPDELFTFTPPRSAKRVDEIEIPGLHRRGSPGKKK